jgi:CBS domain-containing protein
MGLPLSDSDPTVVGRGPATRIIGATTVAEAGAHLRLTGEPAAIVYAHGRPVGLVTAGALGRAAMAGRSERPVGALMDYVTVPADASADAEATVRAFTNAAGDWLRRRRDR